MNKENNRKMYYMLVGCLLISLLVIGGTFAYFTAQASDNTTVRGNSQATNFGVRIEKVTDVDMAYGLIPMLNNRSAKAADGRCRDEFNNAVCQIYRMTIKDDADTTMFLDAYILTTTQRTLETRIASVYTDDDEETFYTEYTKDDFIDNNTLKS